MSFSTEIISWYRRNKRPLPWRNTKDPYKIWLSEIILQQTRVAQGLPYYLKFTQAYPTVFQLADAPEEEVLKLWQGLGYYSRAKNLHATAKHIAHTLNGVFPQTYKELLTLKGVGDYTASAIASICFNEPAPVLDGNVYRVLARYFNIDIPINTSEGATCFKALAKELIDHNRPATYNQAIMEFGAIQCKPQSPDCPVCPLNNSCGALQHNQVAQLPVKLKKGKIKKRYFNYLVITNGAHIALQKRTEKDIWQNLYEFPLIETPGPAESNTLLRHPSLKELLATHTFTIKPHNREPIVHKLSHQHLYTHFWILKTEKVPPHSIPLSHLKNYPVPVLIANFIENYPF